MAACSNAYSTLARALQLCSRRAWLEVCSCLDVSQRASCCCSVKYGGAYESARFSHNTADGITMVGVGCIAGLVRAAQDLCAAAAAAYGFVGARTGHGWACSLCLRSRCDGCCTHPAALTSITPALLPSTHRQGFDLLSWLLSRFLPPVFMSPFHGPALVFMFIYLWSKQFSNAPVGAAGAAGVVPGI